MFGDTVRKQTETFPGLIQMQQGFNMETEAGEIQAQDVEERPSQNRPSGEMLANRWPLKSGVGVTLPGGRTNEQPPHELKVEGAQGREKPKQGEVAETKGTEMERGQQNPRLPHQRRT